MKYLNFTRVRMIRMTRKHTGEYIAQQLNKLLKQWELETKVRSVQVVTYIIIS